MINKEHMELWIQALETSSDRQCRGGLMIRGRGADGRFVAQRCALGIGVEVALQHGAREFVEPGYSVWEATYLSPPIIDFYGLRDLEDGRAWDPILTIDGEHSTIAGHNDNGVSFWTIAQAMREKYLKDDDA